MNISSFHQCANCGACYNICPQKAITINDDGLFYKPSVNSASCVDCSLCIDVCPVNQKHQNNKSIFACGGWHKDPNVVRQSSSGGVFYGLAQSVISRGGVVFSAAYSNDFKTVNFVSSDEHPLGKMLKSKYVESLVGISFQNVKKALINNRLVLFCGTPCQVAGLHRYLGKSYDCLLTCDFACGGLPSHKIYQNHLETLEKKYQSKAQSVDFRPKTHGWKRYAIQIKFQNGKKYLRLGTEDPYLKSFLYGKMTVRDYCMDCKFSECHYSDITIADFWLHDKISALRHEDGISLILCNTQKGKLAIDFLHDDYFFSELELEKASYNNHMQISETKKEKRIAFLKQYKATNLECSCNSFFPSSSKEKIKNWIVRVFFKK